MRAVDPLHIGQGWSSHRGVLARAVFLIIKRNGNRNCAILKALEYTGRTELIYEGISDGKGEEAQGGRVCEKWD